MFDRGTNVVVQPEAFSVQPDREVEAEVIEPIFGEEHLEEGEIAVQVKNPWHHANCFIVDEEHAEKAE
jgi:hypothetical protein